MTRRQRITEQIAQVQAMLGGNREPASADRPPVSARHEAFARNGRLYGVSGGPPGYTHLFSWDAVRGFLDYGNPIFAMREPGMEDAIAWRGFQIGSVAASEDGRYVVLGEREALSQLMVFRAD